MCCEDTKIYKDVNLCRDLLAHSFVAWHQKKGPTSNPDQVPQRHIQRNDLDSSAKPQRNHAVNQAAFEGMTPMVSFLFMNLLRH